MNEKEDIEGWKIGGGHPRGWMPFELYKFDLSAANAAADTLITERFPPDFIYKVTNISAVDLTSQVSAYLAVGYISGGVFRILSSSKPAQYATEDWQGEIYLKEGDQIKAAFVNTTENDDIYLVVNGIKIPIK